MPVDGVVPFPPELAARYRARGYWEDRLLGDVFWELFDRDAARTALTYRDDSVTFGELRDRAEGFARRLVSDFGVKALDRVVVHLPNVPEFLYVYFALQRIRAIPLLALAPHRQLELNHFVRLSEAAALITTNEEVGAIVRRENPGLPAVLSPEDLAGPAPAFTPEDVDPTEPCVLLLSGGTTGIPKLIPRTHNDYVYNSRAAAAVQDITPDSVQLAVAPLAHNMPLACPGVQGFFLSGASVALSDGHKAEDVFRTVEKNRVTHIAAVPALYIRWISDPASSGHDLTSVRLLQSGGQRLQPEVRRKMGRVFPNAFVQENFGMSEGLLTFVRRDDPEEVRMETVGRPVSPDDEVRLIDEEGREVPGGEVGELACRGPYTIHGYYRAADYNVRVFTADGFYCSGDLMRRHPSGSYLVEGRRKDLVNRGGEKISTEEVESLILTHPAVQNVACVPYPDPVLGERMCACVIPLPGAGPVTLEELAAHLLAQGIARFKLPERLELMDDFPLSDFGKVSKKVLAGRVRTATADGAGT